MLNVTYALVVENLDANERSAFDIDLETDPADLIVVSRADQLRAFMAAAENGAVG